MSDAELNVDRVGVETWLRRAAVSDLLPARRRDGQAPPGRSTCSRSHLGQSLAVAALGEVFVVVPIVDADGPRRAVAGDGAFAAVIRSILEGRRVGAFSGEPFAGGGLGRPTSADVAASADERAIDADQSNDSVIVGGSAVVKLFPLTAPGPQPGLDLPVHLATVGFTSLPSPLGALRWTSPAGGSGARHRGRLPSRRP